MSVRQEVLDRAASLISGDRAEEYGDAFETHTFIGEMWGVLLSNCQPIPASDVAAMMICVKLARASRNPAHMDSWIDIAGYAALAAEMADIEAQL